MKVLDLCCRSGGASKGIFDAGFEVEGVDIQSPKSKYPFKFYLGDALEFPLDGYDAYFASAPCQRFSITSKIRPENLTKYPDLVSPLRDRLLATGKPFVLENVVGSPLRKDLVLCGKSFGLNLYRHRVFEIHGFDVPQPSHLKHRERTLDNGGTVPCVAGHLKGTTQLWQDAMGIDWMRKADLAQAIPPAYTAYIFKHLAKLTPLAD